MDNTGYTASDKLAIALACIAGIMAIPLSLAERTPLAIMGFLTLMVGLAIYPIFHFATAKSVRIVLFLGVVVGAVLFGWKEWPERPVVEASQQQPQPSVQPSVQQSNKGNNNTNINGSNNTVVIKRGDPGYKTQLDRIEKLLKDQQDQLTPKKLLAKYPLGYVIFSMDYSEQVFPYHSEALQGVSFDWSTVKLTDHGNDLELTLPDARGQLSMFSNNIGFPKAVGPVSGIIAYGDNVLEQVDVLAITNDSVVVLFGFTKTGH